MVSVFATGVGSTERGIEVQPVQSREVAPKAPVAISPRITWRRLKEGQVGMVLHLSDQNEFADISVHLDHEADKVYVLNSILQQ